MNAPISFNYIKNLSHIQYGHRVTEIQTLSFAVVPSCPSEPSDFISCLPSFKSTDSLPQMIFSITTFLLSLHVQHDDILQQPCLSTAMTDNDQASTPQYLSYFCALQRSVRYVQRYFMYPTFPSPLLSAFLPFFAFFCCQTLLLPSGHQYVNLQCHQQRPLLIDPH